MNFGSGAQLLMSSFVPKQRYLAQPFFREVDGERLPRCSDESIAKEEVFVLVVIGICLRAFGSWMCRPDDGLLLIDHLHHIFRWAEMIDVAVSRISLFERLRGRARAGVSEVDGLGHHEIPMAAEVGVDLFCGNDEEVFVGEAAGSFKVNLLLQ
jgi:hypothetical protein